MAVRLIISVLLAPITLAIFFVKQVVGEVINFWRMHWQLCFFYVAAWTSPFIPFMVVLTLWHSLQNWWHWVDTDEFWI